MMGADQPEITVSNPISFYVNTYLLKWKHISTMTKSDLGLGEETKYFEKISDTIISLRVPTSSFNW